MPNPALVAAGGSLALKGLSALFGGKKKKKQAANEQKQYDENRNARVAGLNLQQKQGEDQRRSRLQLANSLLGGVPETTGAGVRTNVGLDPALFAQLNQERTYDFGSAVPRNVRDPNAGGVYGFLEGLFGGVADTLPYAMGGGGAEGGTLNAVADGPLSGGGGVEQTVDFDDLLGHLS